MKATEGTRKRGTQKEGGELWRGRGKSAPDTSQDSRIRKEERAALTVQQVT